MHLSPMQDSSRSPPPPILWFMYNLISFIKMVSSKGKESYWLNYPSLIILLLVLLLDYLVWFQKHKQLYALWKYGGSPSMHSIRFPLRICSFPLLAAKML